MAKDSISGDDSSTSLTRRPNYDGSTTSLGQADSGFSHGGLKLMKPPFQGSGLIKTVYKKMI